MALYSEYERPRGMRVVSVKLPSELVGVLDAYAARRGLSRSQVIRDALLLYLAFNRDSRIIEDPEAVPL